MTERHNIYVRVIPNKVDGNSTLDARFDCDPLLGFVGFVSQAGPSSCGTRDVELRGLRGRPGRPAGRRKRCARRSAEAENLEGLPVLIEGIVRHAVAFLQ